MDFPGDYIEDCKIINFNGVIECLLFIGMLWSKLEKDCIVLHLNFHLSTVKYCKIQYNKMK